MTDPERLAPLIHATRNYAAAEEQFLYTVPPSYRNKYVRDAFQRGWQGGVVEGWSARDDVSSEDAKHGGRAGG